MGHSRALKQSVSPWQDLGEGRREEGIGMLRHALAVTDFIENPSQRMLMFLETIRRLLFALLEFWDPQQDDEVEALLVKYEEAAKAHAGAEATTVAILPTADPNVWRAKITTGELVSYMRFGTPTPGRAYQLPEPGVPEAGEAELLAAHKDQLVTSMGPPTTFEFLAYDLRAFLHKRCTLDPKPETQNSKPKTRNPNYTLDPKPETQNSKPETRNPKPETLNHKP